MRSPLRFPQENRTVTTPYCVLFKVYIIQTRCGRVCHGGSNANDKEGPRGYGKLGRKTVGAFLVVNRPCVRIPSIHPFSFSSFLFLSGTRQKSSNVFCLLIFYPFCMLSVRQRKHYGEQAFSVYLPYIRFLPRNCRRRRLRVFLALLLCTVVVGFWI